MAGTLAEQLTAQREEFKRVAPQSTQEVMQDSANRLKESGIMDTARHAGDHAPDFVLKNVHGHDVNFASLRKNKRVVICFYRGGW
ncbi:redoxin domain-containing protein [Halodesulfovibrio sp.]|jgi:hypothetical protein|uniref:redoxin domain-containing protein n=1 Tax=Halodesulfovibrio sp. TaxID=1912772 RepID=UPI00344FFE2C